MWRATFLLIVALLMTSGTASAKPNIVLILADDLGYGEVGARHAGVPTPNIDAIASSGVTFTDGYVTAPSCVPSRAGLLTGRYQQELGFYGNPPMPRPSHTGLPEGQATLADALRAQGYHTGMIGKWGLGMHDSTGDPQKQGFDHFFGYYCQRHAHNHLPKFLWRNAQQAPVVHNHFSISGAVSSDDVQRMVEAGSKEAVRQVKRNFTAMANDARARSW